MTPDLILFLALARLAVATAVAMLASRSAVYSALFLVLNLVTVAILYLLLNAAFIAMVQVTVYAGAIMVLFLFVIMLLGSQQAAVGPDLPWQRTALPKSNLPEMAGVFGFTLPTEPRDSAVASV